jgi:hypothetical protein
MTARRKRATSPLDTKHALAEGAEMARKALLARRPARKARAAALAKLAPEPRARDRVRARGPEPARAAKRTATAAAKPPVSAGTLIAEGDSWFDYPRCDVLKALEDEHGFDVESVAHWGHTVEQMAYGEGQLGDFVRCIEKVLRRGESIRAVLLSGGGNDIAGDEFAMLLNHARSSVRGLNPKILEGVIDDRLAEAYVTILSSVTEVCKAMTGAPIRIIVHGYDYAVPDGRGMLGGWGPLPGPWLEPGLVQKGYEPKTEGKPLVGQLIDRFNAMLRRMSSLGAFGHVRYVDLRGQLPNGAGYAKWWANELHPTEKGFIRVAERIAAAI